MNIDLSKGAIGAVLGTVILFSGPAMAITYSVSGDFSGTSNPNGAWTYGELTSLGGTFSTYVNSFSATSGGTVQGWNNSGPLTSDPVIWNNASGTSYTSGTLALLPNWAGFHPAVCTPGPGCDLSDIRFTAPTSGTYNFALSFQGADTSNNTNTIVNVFTNGKDIYSANILGDGSGSIQKFNGSYTLTTGETVDIAVASNNNGDFNSTAVQGTITSPVPLPGTAWLILSGLVGVGAMARRRRTE